MSLGTERSAVGRVVAAMTLAVIVALSGIAANPTANALQVSPARSGRTSLLDMGMGLASLVPSSFWDAIGQPQTIEPGPDGVINVLLLGSDARSGQGVSRTDTMMVVSLKKLNGANNPWTMRAASIPRDTAKIPDPFTPNTSDVFKGRVNTILKKLKATSPNTEAALAKLEIVIESLLQITIDYHALITFSGFHAMVDVVDPISINVTNEIRDTGYWDDPNKPKGVYFPVQNNYQLWTWQPNETSQLCNGLWKTQGTANQALWCHRAMPYVRSRKGSGNSDFKRARRQQEFVYATSRDVEQSHLAQLLTSATTQDTVNQLYTSFPITAGNIANIFDIVHTAQFGNHVVFMPTTYSKHIPGTTAYQLKLPEVRAWANLNLK